MRILYILLLALRLCIVSAKYLPDENALTGLVRNVRSIRDTNVDTQNNNNGDKSEPNQRKLQEDMEEEQKKLQKKFKEEIKKLQENFEEKIQKLQENFEGEHNNLERKFGKEINKRQEKFEERIQKLQEELEEERKTLQEKFEEEIKKLQEKLEEEHKQLQEKFEVEHNQLQEKLEEEQEELQDNIVEELQENFEEEQNKLQENFEEDYKKMQAKFKKEKNKLQKSFETEHKKLQEKIEKEHKKLQEKFEKEKNKQQRKFEEEQKNLLEKSEEEQKELQENVEEEHKKLQKKFEEEKNKLQENYDEDLKNLNEKLEEEQKKLQNQLEEEQWKRKKLIYMLSHVNAAYIKKLQSELDTKINELNNDTSQQAIENKKPVLTTVVQYLTNVVPNWVAGTKPTPNNAQVVINSASNYVVDAITPANSITTTSNGVTVSNSTSAILPSALEGLSGPTNAQRVQLAPNNIIFNDAEDTSAASSSVPITDEALLRSPAASSDVNFAKTSSDTFRNSQATKVKDIPNSVSTGSSNSINNKTSNSTKASVSTASTSNIDEVSTAPSSSSLSSNTDMFSVRSSNNISITGPISNIILSGTETTNASDNITITTIAAEAKGKISNRDTNTGVQSSSSETTEMRSINSGSIGVGVLITSTSTDENVGSLTVSSLNATAVATADSATQRTNDVNNTDINTVSQTSILLTSSGADITTDLVTLRSNDVNNAGVNSVSQASATSTLSGVEVSTNSVSPSLNHVNTAGVNSVTEVSVTSKSFRAGQTRGSVAISTNDVNNADTNSVSKVSVHLTSSGARPTADSETLNNTEVNLVSQKSIISVSAKAKTTLDSVPLSWNYFNNAGVNSTSEAPTPLTTSGNGAVDIGSQSANIESNAGVNSVFQQSIISTSVGSETAVTQPLNLEGIIKADVNTVSISTEGNYIIAATLDTTTTASDSTAMKSLNSTSYTIKTSVAGVPDVTSTNAVKIVSATHGIDMNAVNAAASNFIVSKSAVTASNNISPVTFVIPNDVDISLTETNLVKSAAVDVIPTSNEGLISTTIPPNTNIEILSTFSSDVVTVAQSNAANTKGIVVSATEAVLNETASTITENKSIPSTNADLNISTSVNLLATETVPVETVVEDITAKISFDILTITDNNVPHPEGIKTTTAASIATEAASTVVVPAETIVDNAVDTSSSDVSQTANSNVNNTAIIVVTTTNTVPSKMTGIVDALAKTKVESTVSNEANAKPIVVAETRAAASKSTNVTGAPTVETSTMIEKEIDSSIHFPGRVIAAETVSDIVNTPTESSQVRNNSANSNISVANNEAAAITTEVVPSGIDVILASSTEPSIAVETGARNMSNVVDVISSTDLPEAIVAEPNTIVDALLPLSTIAAGDSIDTISNILSSDLATTVGSFIEGITNATTFASNNAITATGPPESAHADFQTAATVEVITNVEASKITFTENAATVTDVGILSDNADVSVVGTTRATLTINKLSLSDKITHVPEITASVTDSTVLSTANGLNEVFADAVITEVLATTEASQIIQDFIFTPTIPAEVGASLLEVTQQ